MKLKLMIVLLLGLLFQTGRALAVEAGKTLPALGLAEVQSSPGQFVYIDYWASWCGPCRQSFPWMNALQAKLGPKGLKVVAVNVDAKRSDADKFLVHTPAQFTIAYDPQGLSAKSLAIKTMPTSMLVSPEGKVLFVHSGFRTEEAGQLEAKILASMGL
ncbi:MAG: Thiol-disulfide oxidoreductase ResA [Pseudomonadota bacterium]|jgi:cytochrome c biogenesis protein CcmG/thiol:disulfide interchange protein DsbE